MLKFLFDIFPLLVFFGSYRWAGNNEGTAQLLVNDNLSGIISGGAIQASQAPIIVATIAGIVATAIQIAYLLARGKRVDGALWVSMVVFLFFGGLTIYFHDDDFIKWKPTIIYWSFAAAMVVAYRFFGKNLIRAAMEKQIALPDEVWTRLNTVWVLFWVALGLLNLFVAFVLFKADTNAWVSFKAFGVTGLMLVFFVAQGFYLSKHIKDEA
ncbi:septation protein A [Pseudoduganella buxea]|uniref:Inner membrane-spanning protein YciB n=1 Tax=Pseudoduganella buxea TaxID=1949069 RepID=A0ABQ1L8U8_9BURK|nr:septation protein A [Pseudoduganella buxea]GGC21283.1 putative intracellular septation protein A [Pseudoduganella buxea]